MKCQHSYHSHSWISVIKDTISEQQPMNTDIMAWEWISGWHPDHCEPASTWKHCETSPAVRLKWLHNYTKTHSGSMKKCICIVPSLCGLAPLQIYFLQRPEISVSNQSSRLVQKVRSSMPRPQRQRGLTKNYNILYAIFLNWQVQFDWVYFVVTV